VLRTGGRLELEAKALEIGQAEIDPLGRRPGLRAGLDARLLAPRAFAFNPARAVGVLVIGPLARRLDVGSLEGDRLVAISPRPLDAAVLVAMRHVRSPEDDQPRRHLLLVGHERHHALAFCAGTVQIGGPIPTASAVDL
jgi:hypothetical protein